MSVELEILRPRRSWSRQRFVHHAQQRIGSCARSSTRTRSPRRSRVSIRISHGSVTDITVIESALDRREIREIVDADRKAHRTVPGTTGDKREIGMVAATRHMSAIPIAIAIHELKAEDSHIPLHGPTKIVHIDRRMIDPVDGQHEPLSSQQFGAFRTVRALRQLYTGVVRTSKTAARRRGPSRAIDFAFLAGKQSRALRRHFASAAWVGRHCRRSRRAAARPSGGRVAEAVRQQQPAAAPTASNRGCLHANAVAPDRSACPCFTWRSSRPRRSWERSPCSSGPATRWASTRVAARPREREPGALAGRRGSRPRASTGDSCNRGKRGP